MQLNYTLSLRRFFLVDFPEELIQCPGGSSWSPTEATIHLQMKLLCPPTEICSVVSSRHLISLGTVANGAGVHAFVFQ